MQFGSCIQRKSSRKERNQIQNFKFFQIYKKFQKSLRNQSIFKKSLDKIIPKSLKNFLLYMSSLRVFYNNEIMCVAEQLIKTTSLKISNFHQSCQSKGFWKQSIVRCIYGKYPLNPQKIATKGFSTDSVRV